MAKRISVTDTTLTAGTHSGAAGALRLDEKVAIVRALDLAGVSDIEIGTPARGDTERAAMRVLVGQGLKARLVAVCRLRTDDITWALDSGAQGVVLPVPVSARRLSRHPGHDRDWVLDTVPALTAMAVGAGLHVCVAGQDAGHAPAEFMNDVMAAAHAAGARRFRFEDGDGVLDPFGLRDRLAHLAPPSGLELEVLARDHLHLAVANCLAAIQGGVHSLATALAGPGAPALLGDLSLALCRLAPRHLPLDSTFIAEATRLAQLAWGNVADQDGRISSDAAFSHELGILVPAPPRDRRHPQTPRDPRDVGRRPTVALGKHAGLTSVLQACRLLGLDPTVGQARSILARIRAQVNETNQSPTPDDLRRFLAETPVN